VFFAFNVDDLHRVLIVGKLQHAIEQVSKKMFLNSFSQTVLGSP